MLRASTFLFQRSTTVSLRGFDGSAAWMTSGLSSSSIPNVPLMTQPPGLTVTPMPDPATTENESPGSAYTPEVKNLA